MDCNLTNCRHHNRTACKGVLSAGFCFEEREQSPEATQADVTLNDLLKCGVCEWQPGAGGIDGCMQPLVDALNKAGIETVASCCGHGKAMGNIALKDGRELIICPDYDTGRKIDEMFPPISTL